MTVRSGPLKTIGRRLARWYSLACARDDARRYRFRVPSGLWACGRCKHVSFDASALRQHVEAAHAA